MDKKEFEGKLNEISKEVIRRDTEEKVIQTIAIMLETVSLSLEQLLSITKEEADDMTKKFSRLEGMPQQLTDISLRLLGEFRNITDNSSADMIDIVDSTLGNNANHRWDS